MGGRKVAGGLEWSGGGVRKGAGWLGLGGPDLPQNQSLVLDLSKHLHIVTSCLALDLTRSGRQICGLMSCWVPQRVNQAG